jgi:hypothetical protein
VDVETGYASSASSFNDMSPHGSERSATSSSIVNQIKAKAIEAFHSIKSSNSEEPVVTPAMPERLAHLVLGFKDSDQAKITEAEIHRLHHGVGLNGLQEVSGETTPFRTYKRASWALQFKTLSSRAFKNLYR